MPVAAIGVVLECAMKRRSLLVLTAAVVLVGLVLGCGGGSDTAKAPTAQVARPTQPEVIWEGVPFRDVEPEATIAIGAPEVWGLTATDEFLWAMSSKGLHRIDPETGEARVVFLPPSEGFTLAADDTTVWAPSFEENVVRRIEASGRVVATIDVGINPDRAAVTEGSVWVSNHRGGDVSRIDPATNREVARVKIAPKGPAGPQSIEADAGSTWVGVPNISSVVRIDSVTNEVVKTIDVDIPGAIPCGDFAIKGSDVWLTNCDGPSVLRIDAGTNEPVALLSVGAPAQSAVFVGDDLWLGVEPRVGLSGGDAPGGLVQIDGNNKMVDAIGLGEDFAAGDAVLAFESLWVADSAHGEIVRVSFNALGD